MNVRKKKLKWGVFDMVLAFIMFWVSLAMVYPFWYVLMVSLNDNSVSSYANIVLFPKAFSLESYRVVFADDGILRGYVITVLRTVIGTVMSVVCTAMLAYGLHVKYLIGRKWILKYIIITMFFGGGIIPAYIVQYKLGLINSFWIYIIPSLISSWNVMMMRAFFGSNIPSGLEEAAKIDGAHELSTFLRIVLPSSKPIIATISLFNAVSHWNDWWTAEIKVTKQELWPVQNVLRRLISTTEVNDMMRQVQANRAAYIDAAKPESIRMAAVIVVTLPILIVYPFCQKYFVKGAMIGSLKE